MSARLPEGEISDRELVAQAQRLLEGSGLAFCAFVHKHARRFLGLATVGAAGTANEGDSR